MLAGEVGQRKRTKRLSSRFYIGITKMVSNNGNKNTKFGVYKSLCCGYEIVIGAGITFPRLSETPQIANRMETCP